MGSAVPRPDMTCDVVVRELKSLASPRDAEGMRRFGIGGKLPLLGVSMSKLRPLAWRLGRNHPLALELWEAGVHEARMLAVLVSDPKQVTARQMEAWVKDFDSWDSCDGACIHLFRKTPFAWSKADVWSRRRAEFVKRAGFVLMATLAVHDKKAPDEQFLLSRRTADRHSLERRPAAYLTSSLPRRSAAGTGSGQGVLAGWSQDDPQPA